MKLYEFTQKIKAMENEDTGYIHIMSTLTNTTPEQYRINAWFGKLSDDFDLGTYYLQTEGDEAYIEDMAYLILTHIDMKIQEYTIPEVDGEIGI